MEGLGVTGLLPVVAQEVWALSMDFGYAIVGRVFRHSLLETRQLAAVGDIRVVVNANHVAEGVGLGHVEELRMETCSKCHESSVVHLEDEPRP